jgi:UDP-N-acetylmuramoyl-tripeptide--D-alanyl-D-alanine ligase
MSNRTLLTLGRIIEWVRGASTVSTTRRGTAVRGVGNDSRTIGKAEVFIAITTDKDDGHKYVADALTRGAEAALVSKKKLAQFSDAQRKKLIAVDDPLAALHLLASRYRKALGLPVVGITGSNGKTTARNFISTVLKKRLTVGETIGNLNNHLGVPMSLLRFSGNEEVGVLEMGANHTGEIHLLSKTIMPTIGLITNIGYAHIGYFGSLEKIARAKLEIIDGMNDPKGFLLLNGDDPLLFAEAGRIKKKVVFFGTSSRCDIRARRVRFSENGSTSFEVQGCRYALSMPGRHFIYSALPALYLGMHFGVPEPDIVRGLSEIRPSPLRGTIEKKSGATFIVDCYNANPSSMKFAVRFLNDVAGTKPKVAVIGDMLELGAYAKRLHGNLGTLLARSGVKRLLAVGQWASVVAQGAVKAGMQKKDVHCAADGAEALGVVKRIVRRGDVVLLKGSRGVHLETVYEGLKA